MGAPATVMVVNNVGTSPFWAGGTQIPAGQNATYTSMQIQAVVSDVNFWAEFLSSNATCTINGVGIPNNSGPVVAFLLEIAVGNITPT